MPAAAAVASKTRQPIAVNYTERLAALTSLRFFAAASVVILHTLSFFHLDPWKLMSLDHPLALRQSVSFFFVLSGFILARVYPSFGNIYDVLRFYRARFARIWPTHVLCLLLTIAFGSLEVWHDPRKWAASLTLTQSWSLQPSFFGFLNGPSWSLSDEAFFYLCFPVLLIGMRRYPRLPITASALLTVIIVGSGVALICYHNATGCWCASLGPQEMSSIVMVNPLVRIFEFVVGMHLSSLLLEAKLRALINRYSRFIACAAFVMIAFAVASPFYLPPKFESPALPLVLWFEQSGGILPYALLIALAVSSSAAARLLERPLLVRLGNASYAMYLVHMPLFILFGVHLAVLPCVPPWLSYCVYWCVLLLLSDLIYSSFETPLRQLIVTGFCTWTRKAKLAAFAKLIGCVVAVGAYAAYIHNARYVAASELQALQSDSPACARDVRFGNEVELKGMRLISTPAEDLYLELVWKSLQPIALSKVVAVHLLDAHGNIIKNLDYFQDQTALAIPMKAQAVWKDQIRISSGNLTDAAGIGIALYPRGKATQLAYIYSANTDWNHRRLCIPVNLLSLRSQ